MQKEQMITVNRIHEWRERMDKRLKEIIDGIQQQARESWDGQEGEDRATRVGDLIHEFLPSYATAVGMSQLRTMEAIEKRRNYSVCNYYQKANFPSLDSITIYDTKEEALEAVGTEFRCPSCKGISTDPYECNSGVITDGKEQQCNWKSYGLFKCLDKGFKFMIREGFLDHPAVDEIFMPITMEEDNDQSKN